MKFEVKAGQVERPASLAAVKFFHHSKVFQVLVVCPDFDTMPCAFEEMPPLFESSDDCQHFLVMDLIVSLDWGEAFRVERDRVPLVVLWRLLRKHCASCNIQTVCFYSVR